jgi:hypothetical protein
VIQNPKFPATDGVDDSTNRSATAACRLDHPFTQPTATRFTALLAAAILTNGRRNVPNVLRTLGELAPVEEADDGPAEPVFRSVSSLDGLPSELR